MQIASFVDMQNHVNIYVIFPTHDFFSEVLACWAKNHLK